MKCCICGNQILDYGNNPYPVKANGKCCDDCNKLVILARLSTYGMTLVKKEKDEK